MPTLSKPIGTHQPARSRRLPWPALLILLSLSPFSLAAPHPTPYGMEALESPESGQLMVYGALDRQHIAPLLDAFHQRHPEIRVTYQNLETLALYKRFLAAPGDVDVLISSAMPWQYRLANDGHAQPHHSVVSNAWPKQARWRHELFAFTFEPVVMVVHDAFIQRYGYPSSHTRLLDLLQRNGDALRGRIVTYNPAVSGAGYSYAIQEAGLSPRYWDLIAALGNADTQLVNTTAEMLEGLQQERFWVGYNLLGSYAQPVVDASPELELVIPEDYALITQRSALISRQAPNPDNAAVFMDFLLSLQGQQVIATQTPLRALHPKLTQAGSATELRHQHGDALRPLALTPALLAPLDNLKRRALLQRWQREFPGARLDTETDNETPTPASEKKNT